MHPLKYISIAFSLIVLTSSCGDLFFNCHEGNGELGIEKRAVSEFNQVVSSGTFDVIIQGDTTGKALRVEGDENLLELVETTVRNNTLYIELRDNECINPDVGMKIYIYTNNLSEVELEGSGSISINNVYGTDLEVLLSGSGDIECTNCSFSDDFSAIIEGSGDMTLSGKTTNAFYEIDGSGNINATQMKSTNCTVKIFGSGDAYVHAYTSLDIEIDGSGDVYYTGDPDTVEQQIEGSGSINQL